MLPFFPFSAMIACGSNFPVHGQVWKPYRWVVYPIPSLTLEEAFPPTILKGIHSWSEVYSDLEQFKCSMVLVRWRLMQPFWVPFTFDMYPFSIKIREFTFINLLFKGPSR
jgi:hypothetical protein